MLRQNTLLLFRLSHRSQKHRFFGIKDNEQTPKVPMIYPNQYPTNLTDTSPMFSRNRPVRFKTPKDELP